MSLGIPDKDLCGLDLDRSWYEGKGFDPAERAASVIGFGVCTSCSGFSLECPYCAGTGVLGYREFLRHGRRRKKRGPKGWSKRGRGDKGWSTKED